MTRLMMTGVCVAQWCTAQIFRFRNWGKLKHVGYALVAMEVVGRPVQAATYTAIVINAHTGVPLVQHKANVLVYPASLTKLMTLYLACEALHNREIQIQKRLRITRLAASQPPCKWGIVPGQNMDLLTGMKILATRSANDVAVALAETLAPTANQFVARMNGMAQRLGMKNTHFVNPSGWHHPNQKTTAHDLALLLRAFYRRFPQYIHLLGLSGVVQNGQWKPNTNALLRKVPGMLAGKTGYTIPAGWNLATLTQRPSGTLISVVMGMPNKPMRDRHVAQLTEAAFTLCHLAQNPHGMSAPSKQVVIGRSHRKTLAPRAVLALRTPARGGMLQKRGGTVHRKHRSLSQKNRHVAISKHPMSKFSKRQQTVAKSFVKGPRAKKSRRT